MTRQCEDSLTKPSTAALSAPLLESGFFRNCFEASTLESQCVPRAASEVGELQELTSVCEMTYATTKATFKNRRAEPASATCKQLASLEA